MTENPTINSRKLHRAIIPIIPIIPIKKEVLFNRSETIFPQILSSKSYYQIFLAMPQNTEKATIEVIFNGPADWDSWDHQFKIKAVAANL